MQSVHPQELKFEPLVLPENIKAEPIESEVQITEERFEIPTPRRPMETEKEAETSKCIKQELDEAHALQELAKSDDSHSYAFQSKRLTHNPLLRLFATVKSHLLLAKWPEPSSWKMLLLFLKQKKMHQRTKRAHLTNPFLSEHLKVQPIAKYLLKL